MLRINCCLHLILLVTCRIGMASGEASLADLNELFETVTNYTGFTAAITSSTSSLDKPGDDEHFNRLIDFIKVRRDERIDKLKTHLEELRDTAEKAIKSSDTFVPEWPACCGISDKANASTFAPEINIINATTKSACDAPIDPTRKSLPSQSLYETDGCLCLLYADSAPAADATFSESVLEKMTEVTNLGVSTAGIQQMIATLDGIMAVYPGKYAESWELCNAYDPRRRPWMMQLIEKPRRNYRFFVDLSSSMGENARPGGYRVRKILEKLLAYFTGDQGLTQVFGVTVELIQLSNHNHRVTFPSTNLTTLRQFISDGTDHPTIQRSVTMDVFDSMIERNDDVVTVVFSDFTFISDFSENFDKPVNKMTLVDFGPHRVSDVRGSSHVNIHHLMSNVSSSIESMCQQLRFKIVDFINEANHFGITQPYMDFTGDGDIVTFGYPIRKDDKIHGVVAIDFIDFTRGVRNGPYLDTVFFDGRYDSFFVIIDLINESVFMHPAKQHKRDSNVMVKDVFRSEKERQMIDQLKKNASIEPTTLANYTLNSEVDGDITFYWRKSNIIDLAFGIGIFSSERRRLAHLIDTFLNKGTDGKDSVHNHQVLQNLSCSPPLINSFQPEKNNLYTYYDSTVSTQVDFIHIGQQATRNQIFGDNFHYSIQFDFYAEKFASCVNGNYNISCSDIFTPMALIDTCDLMKTIDFGHQMLQDSDYKTKVARVYMASISGMLKTYGPIPPYKFDVAHRSWFNGIRHQTLRTWHHKDYYTDEDVIALTRAVIVNGAKRFVFGVDISPTYFERLANASCVGLGKTFDMICGMYNDDGSLLYHSEYKELKEHITGELTLATVEPGLAEALDEEGLPYTVERCYDVTTGACINQNIKFNVGSCLDENDECKIVIGCRKYHIYSRAIFDVTNPILIVLRNRPVGIGCSETSSITTDGDCSKSNMAFCPVKNELVKNETKYEECDGLRCGCDIPDLGKNRHLPNCSNISQQDICEDSPFCHFNKPKCVPINKQQNMMNVMDKRRKLCDLESTWKAWLGGTFAATFLTMIFSFSLTRWKQQQSRISWTAATSS